MEDLRQKYPGYFGARLDALAPPGGFPAEFWVITACDPLGQALTDGENAERMREFESGLADLGWRYFSVTGYDPRPGGTHREQGFGVVCDEREALRLGRKWEQVAVFLVRGGMVWLVFCSPEEERFFLRSWREMISR